MKPPTVISLFCGCGGSSLGYHYAGYEELLAIDFEDNAVETFKLNFPKVPVWQRDISEVTAQEILDFTGLKVGELDTLDGSPPCQGFSLANNNRCPTDERNDLVNHYIRLVRELQPKTFIMENVASMNQGDFYPMFKGYIKNMKEAGYHVKWQVLNASHYNVPQARERMIVLGVRKDLGNFPMFPQKEDKVITVREALENVPQDEEVMAPKGGALQLALQMKPGEGGSKYHPKGHYFGLRRIEMDKPCPTVIKTFSSQGTGLLHPEEDRYLTISEVKRIFSFPDDFQFIGKFSNKWARLGNCVPPRLMEAIARNMKETVFEGKKMKGTIEEWL
jgi:DNA (cytosine-5)-methyltransferase 1